MFWDCIFTYETTFRNVSKIGIETFYLHMSKKMCNFAPDFKQTVYQP